MTEPVADCPAAATVQHEHGFGQGHKRRAELRTLQVTLLAIITMLAEIFGGWITGSMALLADGVHRGGMRSRWVWQPPPITCPGA